MGAALKYEITPELGTDAFSNILSVNNGITTYTNSTDQNGLLTSPFYLHNPSTLTHDARGRIATQSFASGKVLTFTYDNFDRITRVDNNNGPSIVNIYDAMGRRISTDVTEGTFIRTETGE